MVSIIGIPLDENSSFLKGPAKAPPLIMDAFHSDASNMFAENGVNCDDVDRIRDIGILQLPAGKVAMDSIRKTISKELNRGQKVVSLGGDHSITFPIIESYSQNYSNLNILHFDAHPDLYDNFENNPYSHASPFARIMENGLVKRLVQVGIRTLNNHQKEQIKRFGIEVIEMRNFVSSLSLEFDGPVYVSIDLDALDPAFAPGVSHHEPGGLSTRDLVNVIHQLNGNVVGGDIVEYNPDRDINNMTAVVAAKLLKEVLGKILG
ncbi:MAG: agmatinase [Candidatus Marinimicrobia bacterium]|jgi:agmatinase|nr:agmatinase [Candidatus Neomarinimicrobiota bacterium]MBT3675576.1 agmatinase [Candidatus Neomarinimicrobiota bacterium]MBT3763672.1 agmatinase [Candidatus Neomarinimicrobiota bacterium]MBT4067352.1 agmatinase [Candidatus Neomarinimicrobiota bacterium]MBT4372139.1 agmatinase [Candidatus Neomarinimicrobiota bacterium]